MRTKREALIKKMKKLEKRYERVPENATLLKQRLERKAANLQKVIEKL